MANTPAKNSIFLAPRETTKDSITITAIVTRDYKPQQGVVVQFYRDGSAIPGANSPTDDKGRVDYTMSVPAGATSIKVKAEVPGNIIKELTVGIPPSVQGKNRGELPTLEVEDNSISPTKKRLAMAIFDSKGKMIPGRLQLSSNKDIIISFPFKADQKKAVAKGLQNPGNAHELMMDGERWITVDIVFTQGFELDVLVAGWRQKIELTFDAPKVASKGEIVPMTRPLFAAFCIFLFAVALFSTTIFGFTIGLPLAILLALAVAIVSLVVILAAVESYNRRVRKHPTFDPTIDVAGSIVKTNNNLLATMVLLTLMSFVLLLIVQWGPPVLQDDNRTAMTEQQRKREYVPGDDAQKIRNEKRNIGLVTDRSLTKQLPVVNWVPFVTTFVVFIMLLVLTIGYTFIAFSDEAASAFHSVKRSITGRTTEGVAGPGIFSRLKEKIFGGPKPETVVVPAGGAQATPAATPAPPSGGEGFNVNSIISNIGFSIAIDYVIDFIQDLMKRSKKTEPRRRRYES